MNAAVLKAARRPAAINALITGWYDNANPLAGSATWNDFNQDHVPSFTASLRCRPAHDALYNNVFKQSCRVCHISRDETGKKQIGSFNQMLGVEFGYSSSCTGLGMPHSQRTWGIFWGSRCSNKLGILNVPDMPTLLNTAAGEAGCPIVPDN